MKLQAPSLLPVRVWVSSRSWMSPGPLFESPANLGGRQGGGVVVERFSAVAFRVSVSITG